mmetsp:Transcript_51259/g.116793  ORF Transcript_51259/g.116793 Transcript_51259/m.116793 type:complete len:309 (-) Transcript_51259:377-1303(-)
MPKIITTRHLAQLTANQRPSVKFRLASFLHHTKDACKPKSCQTGLTNRTPHRQAQPSAHSRKPVTDGRQPGKHTWQATCQWSHNTRISKAKRRSTTPVGSQSSSSASVLPPILAPDASPGSHPYGCPTAHLLPIGPQIHHAPPDHKPSSQSCCTREAPPLLHLPCLTSPPHRSVHCLAPCTPLAHRHPPKPSERHGPTRWTPQCTPAMTAGSHPWPRLRSQHIQRFCTSSGSHDCARRIPHQTQPMQKSSNPPSSPPLSALQPRCQQHERRRSSNYHCRSLAHQKSRRSSHGPPDCPPRSAPPTQVPL